MRTNQVHLQLSKLACGNAHIRERAKSGVDPVNDLASLNQLFNESPRALDGSFCMSCQRNFGTVGNVGSLFEC